VLADEHHQPRDGVKNYIATTVAEGCCLGAGLAQTAGVEDLKAAYGVFKEEAQNVRSDYQPKTVNTDGWASTRQAWASLFTLVVVLRCFLHGWLVELDDVAGREWDAVYPKLEDHPDTVFGAATSRASDQVMKLALVFALAGGSDSIRTTHLRAALSCWRYCEATARMLFDGSSLPTPGKAQPDVLAVRLLTVITGSPGINRRDLYRAVGGKVDKGEMTATLTHLRVNHLAHPKNTGTEGRPAECWFPGADGDEAPTVLTVAEAESAPTPEPAPAVVPQLSLVKIEELPTPPDGSLTRLSVPQLFDEVRRLKGRLAWVGGKVGVVGVDAVPVEVACAVAEHQSDLRTFLPAEPQVSL
jgi:hypothetical protein